jgi:hypothetical protein
MAKCSGIKAVRSEALERSTGALRCLMRTARREAARVRAGAA